MAFFRGLAAVSRLRSRMDATTLGGVRWLQMQSASDLVPAAGNDSGATESSWNAQTRVVCRPCPCLYSKEDKLTLSRPQLLKWTFRTFDKRLGIQSCSYWKSLPTSERFILLEDDSTRQNTLASSKLLRCFPWRKVTIFQANNEGHELTSSRPALACSPRPPRPAATLPLAPSVYSLSLPHLTTSGGRQLTSMNDMDGYLNCMSLEYESVRDINPAPSTFLSV
ncbi:hypothetical protein ZWY2020_014630 [Hordeum vulgare]|nr:hypothetical protein ZWY2020_014630 [Hordeum vulgare]